MIFESFFVCLEFEEKNECGEEEEHNEVNEHPKAGRLISVEEFSHEDLVGDAVKGGGEDNGDGRHHKASVGVLIVMVDQSLSHFC